ncbi:conserved membrane hypothetical protein [Candidatus Terasakiella magnetica]|nr:conserved membrane hypothetical protein [Candidatus Terasakiella magnetica]
MTAGLARLALVAAVLALAWWVRDGFGDVAGALDTAGLSGVLIISLYHVLPMTLCGMSWYALQTDSSERRGIWVFTMGRWIKDGVGELAGFLPLSGEVAAIRHLTCFGFRPAMSGAMVVVDVTAEAIAQFFFSILGVGMWLWRYPDSEITRWGLIALGISIPVLFALVAVQRSWFVHFLESLPSKLMPQTWEAPEQETGVLASIHELYEKKSRVVASVIWHTLAWVAGGLEAWIALYLLGHPLSVADILAMESIIFAIRSIAFVVPAAIGLQEGGYMIVGAILGLSTEVALALSLLKRGRELLLGIGALLAWHFVEGGAAKRRQAES